MRVLLAMRNGTRKDNLRMLIENERSDVTVSSSEDGLQTLHAIYTFTPDVLVLDQILPALDGSAVLESIKDTGLSCPPKVVLLSSSMPCSSNILTSFTDACAPAQADAQEVLRVVIQAGDMLQGVLAKLSVPQRRALIEAYLEELGMPRHLKGRIYLVYLLDLVIPYALLIDSLTTKLYPASAKAYGTTAAAVERCIRHAIEATWSKGDMLALERLFGLSIDPERGKPTNREFLAMSAQHIRQKTAVS